MTKSLSEQQEEEKEIVERFLGVASIPYQKDGVQCLNPPHPDVLCTLIDGSKLAFELTEVIDPRQARNVNFGIDVKQEMYEYFQSMNHQRPYQINNLFGNADLFFRFDDGTTMHRFRKLLPKLFEVLLNLTDDVVGDIDQSALPAGVKRITVARGSFVGPMFNASGLALYIANTTIDRIKDKFAREYECDCPTELLVHSRMHALQPDILWLGDVQELVTKELPKSPFRRVWIFDYVDCSIRYVYPEK